MIRRKHMILVGAAAVAMAALAIFLGLVNSQTRWRAEWEHGIVLPASATAFQCRGDVNRLVLDRGASTIFEMAASDVPVLKSRLSINPARQTSVPGNAQHRGFAFPWTGAAPAETLSCDSPKGDWLHVEFYPLDDGRVGVWMYTDWN